MSNLFTDVRVGCLATVNRDGSPRATPLHFTLTESKLIWLSPETAVHSQNIARDGQATFAAWQSPTISICVTGEARVANGDEAAELTAIYREKLGESPKLDCALVYVIDRA